MFDPLLVGSVSVYKWLRQKTWSSVCLCRSTFMSYFSLVIMRFATTIKYTTILLNKLAGFLQPMEF